MKYEIGVDARMVEKKTISLQPYVLKIAEEKAEMFHGGSLSGYINWLICSDNTKKVKAALDEERKPIRVSDTIQAEKVTLCHACNEYIRAGDDICRAKFQDGWIHWVHLKCSKI